MALTLDELKEEAKRLLERTKQVKEQMDEAKEWSSLDKIISNIGQVVGLVTSVVLAVEKAAEWSETLTGEEKLNTAVELLDEMIKLPMLLELVDGPAFRIVISIVVHFINEKYGKEDWPEVA